MAELFLNYADEDFSPDPPTHEEIEFDDTIEHIICIFNQAARGEHLAWALSSAMDSVMLRYGRRNGPNQVIVNGTGSVPPSPPPI